MSSTTNEEIHAAEKVKLPKGGLAALFTAGFLGIINETIPAGLLPKMSTSLGLSQSVVGQTVTIYAVATALTAIPLNSVLKNMGRRNVLTWALVAFAVANAVLAFSNSFAVILIARFVAGIGAGQIWSNIGGYAARIVPPKFQSQAITVAMAGTPVALSLGLPAGTSLGDAAGWHATFGVMAAISVALIAWMFAALPNIPGLPEGGHVPVTTILRARGVPVIVGVVAGFMIAHTIVYTYVTSLAARAGMGGQIELILLVFGVAALLSIWGTGKYVNPHHRRLIVATMLVFGASFFTLGFTTSNAALFYLGVILWGFGFGGSATLFVTAGIRASGTDGIQSILVTVFNVSIALGGVIGGLLLSGLGVGSIPWVAFAIMVPTAIATISNSRYAFPRWPRN
jgi:predicted MFS family arabinose efflux permease